MTTTIVEKKNNKSSDCIPISSSKNLVFPNFDNIKVSTKTFIVMTNITLDIDKIFDFLPITGYTLVPKRRGRKKKIEPIDPNKGIQNGSIITLEYQNKIRGVDLKKKDKEKNKEKNKEKKKRGNYFRNSVTIVMIIDGKKINYKVSRNGKFQMTGCKYDVHSEKCVEWFWHYIKDSKELYKIQKFKTDNPTQPDSYSDSDSEEDDEESKYESKDEEMKAIFIPAMRNIDFSLNFFVDREKLDEYFNTCTDYFSLLETSFGYTGVNIKIPVKIPIIELKLKQLTWARGKWQKPSYITYGDYLKLLPPKEVAKKLKKQRYNTFLVFHSGKIIFSGLEATFMRPVYYEFLNIIRDCFDTIEERLDK
jgi:TATA-box binding protein (TBP) (component of TFIID and TFIIIB)